MPGQNEIASWLRELADRTAFEGAGPFKVRAYREAARRLDMHVVDVAHAGSLRELPGIGDAIAGKILRMARGELPLGLLRLRAEQPAELSWLLRLPGVGPSTARRLWAAGIGKVAEVEELVEAGGDVPGISQGQLRQLQRAFRERRSGVPLPELLAVTDALRRSILGIEPAGDLRRLDPTVRQPTWLAPAGEAARKGVEEALPLRLQGTWTIGRDAVRLVAEDAFGAALLWYTGPALFALELRSALAARGLRLERDGLFDGRGIVPCPTEQEVFRQAGRAWLPPQLRGLEPAQRDAVLGEVHGDLHTHSNWSDGLEDIASMAAAAIGRGYDYLAVTDHSQGLKVAHGLTPERFRRQRQEIEALRRQLPAGFTLLQGCEVDIRSDGSLDLPDDLLGELDLVIAAVHNHFDQSAEEATSRLVRAIAHPLVTAIGHPGSRKLGARPPIAADWTRVFAAAREAGTALELSASPRRLDLDYRWFGTRDAAGLRFVVDTDAHSPFELSYMPLGIAQAQKAGIRGSQVLNAGSIEDVTRRRTRC